MSGFTVNIVHIWEAFHELSCSFDPVFSAIKDSLEISGKLTETRSAPVDIQQDKAALEGLKGYQDRAGMMHQ